MTAVAGAPFAARQILLHIMPGDPGYGSALLGYHYYTWAFIGFAVAIVALAVMLLFDSQFKDDGKPQPVRWRAPRCGWQNLRHRHPGLSSVAVMSYGANHQSQIELRETQIAARRLDLRLHSVPISADTSIENAFEKIKTEPVQALIVVTDPILYSQRSQILDLAAGSRLPAMYLIGHLPRQAA